MHAEDLLRRYLQQRRDQGETELVLDTLSVEDVMRLIGAARTSATTGAPARAENWRDTLRSSGADVRPLPAAETANVSSVESPASSTAIARDGLVVGSEGTELFGGELLQCHALDDISALIAACKKCDLYRTAKHPVPGEGSATARLVCVGEAPGASEDETGRPFVGQAGQLLTKILEAIKLTRDEVFIVNVLKHRPPGNRNPLPVEVEACSPYLIRQLELIRPSVIVAFGTFAAQTLLDTKLSIGKLRGAIHRYHGIPVIVTYHPAALLRNPAWKRPTWEDVQLARRILDGVRK
ncbi:MAG TPA: uracil-DNA glycosylase [Gemmatimonadaceae bacterium]|nr:uracil-DNA glycosylase [Gemmatimonadaceae bacterium]